MIQKKAIKIWDINVNNVVTSKLVFKKNNSKYLVGYLDKVIRSIVLILSIMSGYVKIFKIQDGDKDKNNRLISFCVEDDKLFGKYKTIRNNDR